MLLCPTYIKLESVAEFFKTPAKKLIDNYKTIKIDEGKIIIWDTLVD